MSWLNSHESCWKTFVSHRISKIHKFPNIQWHYVNTKLNPADLASRGILPSLLPECELWWNGPNMTELYFSKFSNNPNDIDISEAIEKEVNKKYCFCLVSHNQDLINYYSSFQKLCSILQQVAKFPIKIYEKRILKNPNKKQNYLNKIQFLNNPDDIAIRLIQKSEFHCEINLLSNKKQLPKSSRILSLYPFLDGFGILL